MNRGPSVLLALLLAFSAPAAHSACPASPLTLQVLGSGGPFGNGRASAGYLLWIDGKSAVMVDAGGGTFTRFHEAEARVGDLRLLALSHFHPDHSAEVPALLWIKPTDMLVSGPSGGNGYPSVKEFIDGLFGSAGVFRSVTDGKGMRTLEIDASSDRPTVVLDDGAIRVRALGVPHGIVPAVGYRIDAGDQSIVFSSDQNGSDPAFVEFADGADVLVIHVAIPEHESGFGADLHAKPSIWGKIARDANIGTLVLSHLSGIPPRGIDGLLPGLDQKLALIQEQYDGALVIAEDLMCLPIAKR